MAVAWPAAIIANSFAGDDTPLEPRDIDPLGVFGEREERKPAVAPYDPSVLQDLQNGRWPTAWNRR